MALAHLVGVDGEFVFLDEERGTFLGPLDQFIEARDPDYRSELVPAGPYAAGGFAGRVSRPKAAGSG